jgi:hypothetical protein
MSNLLGLSIAVFRVVCAEYPFCDLRFRQSTCGGDTYVRRRGSSSK